MHTVFDIGMYDGEDTGYYLSEGLKVVAVEANPTLIERATAQFSDAIQGNRLVLINAALSDQPGEQVTLHLSGDDLGSSTLNPDLITSKTPIDTVTVETMTLPGLLAEHGVPYYLKIDIEGADRHGILPLTEETRPSFLSFEAGDDWPELVDHLSKIGFTKFKAVCQIDFVDLPRQFSLLQRARRRALRHLGYKKPKLIRIDNRDFVSGHSAGPVPWKCKGRFMTAEALLTRWRQAEDKGELAGWYDIHAA